MKSIGFGAILWDDIGAKETPRNIGGSVFNVIAHLRKLGHQAYIISSIGKDPVGEKTFTEVDRLDIERDFISQSEYPTCLIPVRFDSEGSPHYTIPDNVSWDQITINKTSLAALNEHRFDCLVYGTLEQRSPRSRQTLRKVLESGSFRYTFVDLTLRGNFYDKELLDYTMRRASIIKMNNEEAMEVNRIFNFNEKRPDKLVSIIVREFDAETGIITIGKKGVWAGDQTTVIHRSAYKVKVEDTVGSGDAFSAGFLYQYLNGETLEKACDYGNRMASVITSKKSSIPEYRLSEIDSLREKE